MIAWRSFILALAMATTPAHPAPGSPLPPEEAAREAIDARPAVRAALAERDAAVARADALRAGPHQFAVEGAYQERDVDGEGSFDEWEAGLIRGVRWPGKARVDRDLGDLELEHATNALADARHGEARALLEAWFGWLRAAETAGREDAVAGALERAATTVRAQLERGDASPMQLELALAEAGRARALASRARIAAAEALRVLERGFPGIPVPAQPPEAGPPGPVSRPLEEWPTLILQRSHELRLAELEMKRAALKAERARKDRWPDPTLGLRVVNERDGAEQAVGFTVVVPLPSRHGSAQAAEARSQAAAASARFEAARRDLELVAAADVAAVRAALEAWEPMQTAAVNAGQHVTRAQRAYELGETSLTELLLSLQSASAVLHERSMAALDAHEALARLAIDAHELWAPHDGDHHEE